MGERKVYLGTHLDWTRRDGHFSRLAFVTVAQSLEQSIVTWMACCPGATSMFAQQVLTPSAPELRQQTLDSSRMCYRLGRLLDRDSVNFELHCTELLQVSSAIGSTKVAHRLYRQVVGSQELHSPSHILPRGRFYSGDRHDTPAAAAQPTQVPFRPPTPPVVSELQVRFAEQRTNDCASRIIIHTCTLQYQSSV